MIDTTTRLIAHAELVVAEDDAQHGWRDASVLIREREIAWLGPAVHLPTGARESAAEVIDARGHVVTPGLINTRHHMYQSLTRALPAAQNAELFGWLTALYPVWAGLTPHPA